jgi:hypothetical protein
MNSSATEFTLHIINAIALGTFFFVLFDLIGQFFLKRILGQGQNIAHNLGLFAGTILCTSLYSIFLFKGKTTQITTLIALTLGSICIVQGKKTVYYKERNILSIDYRRYLFGILIIALLVILKFLQLIDENWQEYNTEFCDHYNYIDNITWTEKYHEENVFPEFESFHFNQSKSFSLYHFFEYNLAVLIKNFYYYNNFIFFEIALLPILLAFGIISLGQVLYLQYKKPLNYIYICIIPFFLYHREFGIHYYLTYPFYKIFNINQLFSFPFQAISDAFYLYPSSYIPKISVFFFGFSGYLFFLFSGNLFFRFSSLGFLLVANITYLPFLAAIEFCLFLLNPKKEIKNISASIFIFFSLIIYFKIITYPDAKNLPYKIPGISFDLNVKNIFLKLRKELFFVFGNFFMPLILFATLFWTANQKSKPRFYLLILIFIFPFIFISEKIFLKIYLSLIIIFLFFQGRKILKFIESNQIVLILLTSFLLCLVAVNIGTSFNESFQFGYNSFIPLITIIPIIIILSIKKFNFKIIGICILFIIFGIQSQLFYFNRIFFPGSSIKFANDFYKNAGKMRINSVYYSNFEEIPYFYVSRLGFTLQNYSDSLFTTCVSFHKMTQKDSTTLSRVGFWGLYNTFPFVKFCKKLPNDMSYDEKLKRFMIENKVKVFFIRKDLKHETPHFIQIASKSELFCNQFGYYAYILKDKWIENLNQ